MENIQGRADIVRDPNTRAIINVDVASHKTAVASSKARELAKEQLKINTTDINSIRNELLDIKSLLKQLVDKNG
mgnify:FL=1